MEGGRYRDSGRASAGRLGHRRAGASPQRRTSAHRGRASERASDNVGVWTKDEQNLALAYEITGRLPIEEIARRLGRDQATVAKMLVAAKAGWGARKGA
jgi:hypothetical protein